MPGEKRIMNAAQLAKTASTRGWAQGVVLIALLCALGIGWHEHREISPADIPLANLAREASTWQTTTEQVSLSDDNAYKLLERTYENDQDQKLHVTIQSTYTRLGALRDWSLASMASGWTTEQQCIWKSNEGANGFPMEARIQTLVNGPRHRVALIWYTSAQSQAPTLQRAELKAWRDRLLGGKKPWASMYVVAETDPGPRAEEAVQQLARQLAPELRLLMSARDPY